MDLHVFPILNPYGRILSLGIKTFSRAEYVKTKKKHFLKVVLLILLFFDSYPGKHE